MKSVASRLLAWHADHGRHDLPWQHPRSAYRVWVSEIMLQQTQVQTVVAYFQRFVAHFPDLQTLAAASEDEVLTLWSGLGYYRRARFMHRAAQVCVQCHHGVLPQTQADLMALPGIGRTTAAAILAQAHGMRCAILDGNVKRVLTRHHGVRGWPGDAAVEKRLWSLAERQTPECRVADYTQAIMDLGATVCTRAQPRCTACPLRHDCVAARDGLTAELPQRKARKPLPSRHVHMLLMRDGQGRVLLEQRDDHGVWPCLWSLPESDGEHALAFSMRWIAGAAAPARALPPFVHTFSHYRLHVQPLLWVRVSPRRAIADTDGFRWCSATAWADMALPAPVRRLLDTLGDHD